MKSAKPKDLTGSLVHYKEKRSHAPRVLEEVKRKVERDLAFDPFTFAIWSIVGFIAFSQLLLLVLPEFM